MRDVEKLQYTFFNHGDASKHRYKRTSKVGKTSVSEVRPHVTHITTLSPVNAVLHLQTINTFASVGIITVIAIQQTKCPCFILLI